MDLSLIDPRIVQKPTLFSLYLRLPQHRYFSEENRIEEIYLSVSKQSTSKNNQRLAELLECHRNYSKHPRIEERKMVYQTTITIIQRFLQTLQK